MIFTVLCSFLLFQDFYIAFIEKPTLTTHITESLQYEDFPDFMLCPEPSVDLSLMQRLGYEDYAGYMKGEMGRWSDKLGNESEPIANWAGNQSKGVVEVFKELSVLNSVSDCPDATIFYKRMREFKETKQLGVTFANYSLSSAMFPYHRCCRMQYIAKETLGPDSIIDSVLFAFNSSLQFKVMMGDHKIASMYKIHEKNVFGDSLSINKEIKGGTMYKLKISKEIHLENDPKYPCKDYRQPGDYNKCLEENFLAESFELLNCTPPWLTNQENLWCEGSKNLSTNAKTMMMLDYFLSSVSFGTEESKCPVPCLVSEYQAERVGFVQSNEHSGIILKFDKTVKKTLTGLQVTALSLLSKFGGIIGLGKNLLWIIILACSSFNIFSMRPRS